MSSAAPNSSKAAPTMNKVNIPFCEADLAAIILASFPMRWQNQYILTHSTVPELPRMLLPDLENIERVKVQKQNEKLKAKGKASTAHPNTKCDLKRKASRGLSDQVS